MTLQSLGDSLSTQNPVSHSPEAPGREDSQTGALPERNKTLAQGPDFQGNQLAHWAGGKGGHLELKPIWAELFSYSIIYSSTLYSYAFYSFIQQILLGGAR